MRLIDADVLISELKESALHHCNNPREDSLLQRDRVIVRAQPTVEAIPKADYEHRLKADLKAVLVDLQLEIEEKEQYYQDKFLESKNAVHDAAMGGRMFGCGECKELIQEKINSLKAEREGKE